MINSDIYHSLIEKREELVKLLRDIEERIKRYRKGTLFCRDHYYYIKYYNDGKVISEYVGKDLSEKEIDDINRELKNYKTLDKKRKTCIKELKEIEKMIKKYERRK